MVRLFPRCRRCAGAVVSPLHRCPDGGWSLRPDVDGDASLDVDAQGLSLCPICGKSLPPQDVLEHCGLYRGGVMTPGQHYAWDAVQAVEVDPFQGPW